jgi:hypothetical protein
MEFFLAPSDTNTSPPPHYSPIFIIYGMPPQKYSNRPPLQPKTFWPVPSLSAKKQKRLHRSNSQFSSNRHSLPILTRHTSSNSSSNSISTAQTKKTSKRTTLGQKIFRSHWSRRSAKIGGRPPDPKPQRRPAGPTWSRHPASRRPQNSGKIAKRNAEEEGTRVLVHGGHRGGEDRGVSPPTEKPKMNEEQQTRARC